MTRLISFYAWKDKSVGTQDDELASAIAKSHTCQPTWRSCGRGLGVAPSERALCMWCARMKGVTSEVDKYRADGWTDGAEGGRAPLLSLSLSALLPSRRVARFTLSPSFLPSTDGRTADYVRAYVILSRRLWRRRRPRQRVRRAELKRCLSTISIRFRCDSTNASSAKRCT